MKKAILIITAILCLFATAKAQTAAPQTPGAVPAETKTPPKPVYSPDLTKKTDIVLTGITLQEWNDYLFYEQRGAGIDDSTDISAKQVKDIKINAGKVVMAISKKFTELIADDKAKWEAAQADTGKSTKAKTKKPVK